MDKESDWLSSYRKKITSQHGEDGIIEKIFEIIKDTDKWCVEFGADDGKRNSNTWNLITNKGWSAVQIEADTKKYKKLLQTYKNHDRAIYINKLVNFKGPNTLDNLLLITPVPKSFDLLSIDIDGNDYHIWDSIKPYKPKVVIIEFNPSIPVDIEFVQPKDIKVRQGSSLLSLIKLGKKKGYELVATTSINAFFVKKEYFELFEIKNNSPSLIHKEHKYETRLFQLYDGTLVLSGCKELIWHRIEIRQEEIQVLPWLLRRHLSELNPFLRILLALLRREWFERPFRSVYRIIRSANFRGTNT